LKYFVYILIIVTVLVEVSLTGIFEMLKRWLDG